ncbi:uncharacterized protein [Panulirus ornatus]|uniref:uncharacterized protein n=1 Tax=Panulirus ornatus TaxID=150431 RepID=UPI003A89A9B7
MAANAWAVRAWVVGGLVFLYSRPSEADCHKYFSFPGETDPSVLKGPWVTLASTRRLMPCHSVHGHLEPNSTTRLEETWLVPGWAVEAWRYNVTERVASVRNQLQVIEHDFQGVLRGGRVGVGVLGDVLLLVQCSRFLWVPLPAFTVLARATSSNPAEDVRRVLDHFQVPKTRQSFTLVQHGGCETMTGVQESPRVNRATLKVGEKFWARLLGGQRRPKWEIRNSPDRTLI